MTWFLLALLALIALSVAYAAGRERGHAEGLVAGVLIAQEGEVGTAVQTQPVDPISAFVERQRIASEEGLQ